MALLPSSVELVAPPVELELRVEQEVSRHNIQFSPALGCLVSNNIKVLVASLPFLAAPLESPGKETGLYFMT